MVPDIPRWFDGGGSNDDPEVKDEKRGKSETRSVQTIKDVVTKSLKSRNPSGPSEHDIRTLS